MKPRLRFREELHTFGPLLDALVQFNSELSGHGFDGHTGGYHALERRWSSDKAVMFMAGDDVVAFMIYHGGNPYDGYNVDIMAGWTHKLYRRQGLQQKLFTEVLARTQSPQSHKVVGYFHKLNLASQKAQESMGRTHNGRANAIGFIKTTIVVAGTEQ